VAAAALSVNSALVDEPKPSFLAGSPVDPASTGRAERYSEVELFAAAEAAAWADDPSELLAPLMDPRVVPREDVAAAMAKAARLITLREDVVSRDQLVHGDMLGCTIFDAYADPVVVDMVPAWRPAPWSVALLVVDAVAWANAEDELIDRWSHLPEFNQLLLRAVIYRLFVHAALPGSSAAAWPGIERVSDIIAVRITGRSGRSDIIDGDGEDGRPADSYAEPSNGDSGQETTEEREQHDS